MKYPLSHKVDTRFKYTSAKETTPERLRKLFARIRKEQERATEPLASVTPIKTRSKA